MDITSWLNEVTDDSFVWYAKRLSGNDTLANGAHQAGPYIPKGFFFKIFPSIQNSKSDNPDKEVDLTIDSHASKKRRIRAVWYNNKVRGCGTRDEARMTNFGGAESPLLDPESTGALVVFAFHLDSHGDADECRVWVCKGPIEENLVEERIGPVEPGKWQTWSTKPLEQLVDGVPVSRSRKSCWLEEAEIPKEWLEKFPSPNEIIAKTLSFRPNAGADSDERLVRRRACEYEIFRSVEEAVELPFIRKGFVGLEDFISAAQSILQRRKARSGKSLELHIRAILAEEGLREDREFAHQPESDPGKRPDFLFPSEEAYKNMKYPDSRLRMLAVKTTCKDRWRQVINEADRIKTKHLLTLQEGLSQNQFREMTSANVKLVVPKSLIGSYPKPIRPYIKNLDQFIGEIKSLYAV